MLIRTKKKKKKKKKKLSYYNQSLWLKKKTCPFYYCIYFSEF